MKKVFCKAPSRIVALEEHPTSLLPPQPVLTHWCTWLKADEYYSKNLQAIEEMIPEFPDTDNTACVALVREIVKTDIEYIRSNCISDSSHYKTRSIQNMTARLGGHC
jgi:hypothetical protein